MAEIKLSFDLTFSRRFITAAGAAAMMLCAVPELDSESVTLSTYYPAPSGVYTNMITTGNTYLARDGGAASRVGIGTITPGAKLDVSGLARVQQLSTTGGNALNTADPYAADLLLGSDQGTRHDSTIMMWSAASALRLRSASDVLYLNTWNQPGGTYNVALAAGVGQTSNFNGSINTTGALQTRQGAACTDGTHAYGPGGGATVLCAGQYITLTDGVYSKKTIMYQYAASGLNPDAYTIDFRCCPCPAGGCGGM